MLLMKTHPKFTAKKAIGACLFVLLFPLSVFAANSYYVTQSGSGLANGALGNPWSIAAYNASSQPTGGDTVYFSGNITSTVTPATSGTGNGTLRLVLDFTSATLNTANPYIKLANKAYLSLLGGTLGANDLGAYAISFADASTSHDITISGFTG